MIIGNLLLNRTEHGYCNPLDIGSSSAFYTIRYEMRITKQLNKKLRRHLKESSEIKYPNRISLKEDKAICRNIIDDFLVHITFYVDRLYYFEVSGIRIWDFLICMGIP